MLISTKHKVKQRLIGKSLVLQVFWIIFMMLLEESGQVLEIETIEKVRGP